MVLWHLILCHKPIREVVCKLMISMRIPPRIERFGLQASSTSNRVVSLVKRSSLVIACCHVCRIACVDQHSCGKNNTSVKNSAYTPAKRMKPITALLRWEAGLGVTTQVDRCIADWTRQRLLQDWSPNRSKTRVSYTVADCLENTWGLELNLNLIYNEMRCSTCNCIGAELQCKRFDETTVADAQSLVRMIKHCMQHSFAKLAGVNRRRLRTHRCAVQNP
jgi:hypothetical protein